jgi:ribose transport system substrate-binding protein
MRKSLVAAVLTASAVLLASCAMPADDPNWNAEEAALGEFAEDAEAEAEAASGATASVEAAFAAPTSIGVDVPLTAAPEPGSLIVSLTDGSTQDTLLNESMAAAAEVLGWEFQEVAGIDPADPLTSAPAAFGEALALEPAGIRISGGYVDAITDGLAEAEAAGIPVICTGCAGEPSGAIIDTSLDGPAQNAEWGALLSSYVFANKAEGEDATVEIFTTATGAEIPFNQAFIENLSTLCRECASTEQILDSTVLADPAAYIADTMSISLGRWALMGGSAYSVGVADALSTALVFEPIILIGRGAGAADIAAMQATPAVAASDTTGDAPAEEVAADTEAAAEEEVAAEGETTAGFATAEEAAALQAWTALPVPVLGWRVVDQFARAFGGEPLADGPLPSQLITVATAADVTLDEGGNYIGIADYQDQFKALWGVQ